MKEFFGCRGKIGRCVAIAASLLMLSEVALAQVKPALVRDVDRPSTSSVAVTCQGLLSCPLYTVPANMVLVVETVSYLVQVGSACTEPPIPTIYASPNNSVQVWLPRPSPGIGQFAAVYSDVAAVRLYIVAGSTLNFLFNVPGQSCSSTQPVTHATMYGYLVAAGTP